MSPGGVELVGYAGSVLVAISLTMSSLMRLRWINLVGALAFAVHGVLVGAYPVLAVNAFIVVVNVVSLWRMARQRDFFTLLPVVGRDDSYRDLQCARFFLAEMTPVWRRAGRSGLVVRGPAEPHRAYLAQLGFRPADRGPDGVYARPLGS